MSIPTMCGPFLLDCSTSVLLLRGGIVDYPLKLSIFGQAKSIKGDAFADIYGIFRC